MINRQVKERMHRAKILGTLALILMVGAVACERPEAEDPEDAADLEEQLLMPQQEMDPEIMELIMEMQEIQQKLGPIQQQAMQDATLMSTLQDLQERIESGMRAENPTLMDRVDTFQSDMMAAQEAGDQERLQQMMMEAQGLQQEMQALQSHVLDQPDIRADVEAFEAAQRARMIEIDPEAEALLDRADEIMEALDG